MQIICSDVNGDTVINGRRDMLQALGLNGGVPVIMTDESGAVVGAGFGGEGLVNSMPMIKSLRESQPIAKKPMMVRKPQQMVKSMQSHLNNQFSGLLRELEEVQLKMRQMHRNRG
jgi:hypothetical protein